MSVDQSGQQQPAATQQSEQQQTSQQQPAPSKPKVDLSRSFSALSRQERELRAQKEQFEAERQKAKASEDKFSSFKKKFVVNPIEALKEFEIGLSYDDLVQAGLNNGETPDNIKLRAEIEELKARLDPKKEEETPEQKADRESREEEAKVEQQFVEGLDQFVVTNNEKYQLINKFEASGIVFNVIKEHYLASAEQGSPKVLSYDEACDLVEEYFGSVVEEIAQKKGYKKAIEEVSQSSKQDSQPRSQQSTTLSNQLNSTRPVDGQSKLLPRDESLRRAAMLLRDK
jgi:hypothetical protein